MKEWHIDSAHKISLAVDKITLLKGRLSDWKELVDSFYQYFDNKTTAIKISENKTILPRNDYTFYMVDLSASSKEFQKAIEKTKQHFLNRLEFSPFYQQFVDSWEALEDEVEFLSMEMNVKPLHFSLEPFKKKRISEFISLSHSSLGSLDEYDKLLFQIKMLEQIHKDKRNLVCIVSPEKFLSVNELTTLVEHLNNKQNGAYYFFITNEPLEYPDNISYKNTIVNEITCLTVREQLRNVLPFDWDEGDFSDACNWYRKLVDNLKYETVFLNLQTVDNLKLFVYIYSLFILTELPVNVDVAGIPSNLKNYFDDLMHHAV